MTALRTAARVRPLPPSRRKGTQRRLSPDVGEGRGAAKWLFFLAASIAFSLVSSRIAATWYWTSVDRPRIAEQETPDSTYVPLPVTAPITMPTVNMGT